MRSWILVAVIAPFYFAPPHAVAQQSNLNQVLNWLPVDTETVLAANGPFAWNPKAFSNEPSSQKPLTATELEMQFRMFPLGLLNFANGGLGEFIKSKTASLAIEGSRRFRPPSGLGLMRYEGCLVMTFAPTVSLDGAAFMSKAVNSAVRFEGHNGTRVAVFEEKAENDTWTTFVGFPRSNVAVVATNLYYLFVLLDRMRGTPGTRALPPNLSEWKHVDTNAPVWGVRHYLKQGAELDPSSPLLGQNAASVPDANAVGVTFSFAPAAKRTATVDYFSTNPDVRRILSGYLMMEDAATAAPREFQMRLQQPAAGALEASINLSATEAMDGAPFSAVNRGNGLNSSFGVLASPLFNGSRRISRQTAGVGSIQMVYAHGCVVFGGSSCPPSRLSLEERAALRREHAEPWIEEIQAECLKLRSALLPKSTLGEAVNYTLNIWVKLRRCFDHAGVELSNNVAENSMRPVAYRFDNPTVTLPSLSQTARATAAAIARTRVDTRALWVSAADGHAATFGIARYFRKPSRLDEFLT